MFRLTIRCRFGTLVDTVGLVAVMLSISAMRAQQPAVTGPAIDFAKWMQPIPSTAAFSDPGYYVWCGTMVHGDDGKYHLYYSRWPVTAGFNAWITRSEIAHAIGGSPTGEFHFHDVALPVRGAQFWDGLVTHNPTIQRFDGKYYLYYMGTSGDGKIAQGGLNWSMRNLQRVGVATAENPNGPWKRLDHPIIGASADPTAPDSLCVTNPSLTRGRDGRYYLIYKAVGREHPLPFGGPVVHLLAVSDTPIGPFRKNMVPLLTLPDDIFPFEDPFLWFDRARDLYFVLLKDNKGQISGLGHSSLVLFQSKDSFHWQQAEHAFVSDLALQWKDRAVQHVERLERPQLTFDDASKPIALLAAIREDDQHTFNVRIPLAATPADTAQQAVAEAKPVNSEAADFAQIARYRQANTDLLASNSSVLVDFLGDSITDRWGRQAGRWFGDPAWINRGIGGQTTGQMLLRMRSDVLELHPRAVVIEGASNDMRLGFSPDQIRANIATMGELAQAHGITVFVTAMLPVCDCFRQLTGLRTVDRIARLNNLLRALCEKKGWTFIDWSPALRDERGLMRLAYTSDGVHPNDEGYRLLTPLVEHALRIFHQ